MELVDRLNESMLPFGRLLGMRYVSAAPDRIVAELVVRDEICTVPAIIHGGAIMAFADTLGGTATVVNLPEGAKGTTTIESKTNFLSGAPVGTRILGECTPIHRGRRTQVWQTRITTEAGKLVALVTQTQMVL
jgi:1,4-dihydroxy-2-naphthoyl-CoA hydrolase